MESKPARAALRTSLYYGVAATLWILLSDWALSVFAAGPIAAGLFQTVKGLIFVAVTASLLYLVLRRQLTRWGQGADERRAAQAALAESEAHYRFLFDNMLEGVAHCRMLFEEGRPTDFVYLDVNRAFGTLTGLKNVVGRKVSEVIPGIRETNPELLDTYGRVARTGNPDMLETYVDPLKIWFSISVYSPRTEQFVAAFENITERKRAEEALLRQNTLVKGINRVLESGMTCHTEEELGQACLAVAQEMTQSTFGFIGEIDARDARCDLAAGYSGRRFCRMTTPSDRATIPLDFDARGIYGRVVLDGEGFFSNAPARHPDSAGLSTGHPALESFLGVPLLRDGLAFGMVGLGNRPGGYSDGDLHALEGLAVAIVQAFTRHRAAQALRESEWGLRQAEVIAHLGHWRIDLRTQAVFWSDEIYRIFGVSRETFHPTLDRWMDLIHTNDREGVSKSREKLLSKGHDGLEYRIVRPDGTLRYVVRNGEVEPDEEGRPAALFGTLQDATELRQKQRELEEKNAELERFAYMISHDLRSPLVTVNTFLGYLRQDMTRSDTERIEQDMRYIDGATKKMGQLLNELLEMTRIGRVINSPVRVTFRELVNEAFNAVAGRIAERQAKVQVDGPPMELYGDRPRLAEIWQNLLENAVKFMGDQTAPLVRIGVELRGDETLFFVRDNGIGIAPEYHEKVFGMFEKLDPRCEGTGLGLAFVRRIVELYQGKIWLESQGAAGQGTCIWFTLPAATTREAKGVQP